MVVDDDDRIRELVKQYLEEKNFLVTTAKMLKMPKKLEIIKFDIINFRYYDAWAKSGLDLTKKLKKIIIHL